MNSSTFTVPAALSDSVIPFAPPSVVLAAAVAALAINNDHSPLLQAFSAQQNSLSLTQHHNDHRTKHGSRDSSALLERTCVDVGLPHQLARAFAAGALSPRSQSLNANSQLAVASLLNDLQPLTAAQVPWRENPLDEIPTAYFIRGQYHHKGANHTADAGDTTISLATSVRATVSAWPEVKPMTPTELAWLLFIALPVLEPAAFSQNSTTQSADTGFPFSFVLQQALAPNYDPFSHLINNSTNVKSASNKTPNASSVNTTASALLPSPLYVPPALATATALAPVTSLFPSEAHWRRARLLQARAATAAALLTTPVTRVTAARRCYLPPSKPPTQTSSNAKSSRNTANDAGAASGNAERVGFVASSSLAFTLSAPANSIAARRNHGLSSYSQSLTAAHAALTSQTALQRQYGSGGESSRTAFTLTLRRNLTAARTESAAAVAALTPSVFALAGPALAALLPYASASPGLPLRPGIAVQSMSRRGGGGLASGLMAEAEEAAREWRSAIALVLSHHYRGPNPLFPLSLSANDTTATLTGNRTVGVCSSHWACPLPAPASEAAVTVLQTVASFSTSLAKENENAGANAGANAATTENGNTTAARDFASDYDDDHMLVNVACERPEQLGSVLWSVCSQSFTQHSPSSSDAQLNGDTSSQQLPAIAAGWARDCGALPWQSLDSQNHVDSQKSHLHSLLDPTQAQLRTPGSFSGLQSFTMNSPSIAGDSQSDFTAAGSRLAEHLGLTRLDFYAQKADGRMWLLWAPTAVSPAVVFAPHTSAGDTNGRTAVSTAASCGATGVTVCASRCLECSCSLDVDATHGHFKSIRPDGTASSGVVDVGAADDSLAALYTAAALSTMNINKSNATNGRASAKKSLQTQHRQRRAGYGGGLTSQFQDSQSSSDVAENASSSGPIYVKPPPEAEAKRAERLRVLSHQMRRLDLRMQQQQQR